MRTRVACLWLLSVLSIAGCTTTGASPTPSRTPVEPSPTSSGSLVEQSPTLDETVRVGTQYILKEYPYLPLRWGLWWNDAALIDFDNDGDLDVVVIHVDIEEWQPTPARVLENDGTGRFRDVTRTMYPDQEVYSIGVNALLVADFTGDGLDDVYFIDQGRDAEPWGGNVNTLLVQTPDGHLEDQTSDRIPPISNFTHDAAAADIDGDGDLDIYNSDIYGGDSGATLYINNGEGFFHDGSPQIPAVLRTMERKFNSSEFADVDNDGDMDLVLGSHGGGLPSEIAVSDTILWNDGSGNFDFAPEATLPERTGGPTWGVVEVAVGDLDNNGWIDLVMCVHHNYQETFLQILLNNGDGTFRNAPESIQGDLLSRVFRVDLEDLNGDGLLDILVASDEQFKLYFNAGEATFIDGSDILPINTTVLRPILPGDLDGDGDMDMLLLTWDSHYYVALNVSNYELP